MKKLLYVVAVFGFIFTIACGGGDSAEAVFDDFFEAFEAYIDDMGKAESADDVVNVMEKYTKTFQDLTPRMQALKDKYKDMKPGEMPDFMKNFGKKFQEIMPKATALGAKMMKFMSDPKVMEAQKKFQEAMQSVMR